MIKTVWITRTQPSADESAKLWRVAGFEPLVLPLLSVHPIDHDPLPKDTVVLFTSKNGVAHFQRPHENLRAICVGDATAEKARAAGYRDVVSVDGTSADLTAWVLENLPSTQAVCHVSGWHVRGSISEDLGAAGFTATRLKVYRSKPVLVWPDVAFDFVALYSPLAAQTFADLCARRDVSRVQAICISAATAAPLAALNLKTCSIALTPREDEQILVAQSTPCG